MEKLIELPRQTRSVELRANTYDDTARTIDLTWTTGATVRRYSWMDGPYDEELIVSAKSVRLDRLNAGASFLNSHDGYDLASVIGGVVPKSARIEGGVGVATVRLSSAPEDASIVQKIRDGIIRNISVGYRVHAVEKLERDNGTIPLWRVTDWEPFELSAVAIPADAGAQFRADDKDSKATPLFTAVMTCADLPVTRLAAARMRMFARELGLTV